jgi:X-Pro dipeptidyl-peptidase
MVVAVLSLAAVLAPAGVASAAAPDGETTVSYIVPTRHGDVYLEVVHPTLGGSIVRGPVILTYTPYAALGRNGDAGTYVPKGYVRATADVVGTGNSGGCWDYGGDAEKRSGYDVVEWIARQPWSTGRTAMIGGSYEGTTATATAVEHPPHLSTIVPIAAISRWYGYAFSGGVRYSWTDEALGLEGAGAAADEGLDTPFAFDFGLALPPPLDPQDPNWGERVASTVVPCDEVEHTQHGYDDTPDYDAFWVERDYLREASTIDIPVLVAHNWGDWNVKQEEGFHLYQALTGAPKRVLFFGTRWEGHGSPGGDFQETVLRWFDHYLKGSKNGAQKLPAVISQTSTSAGPGGWLRGPYPATTALSLYPRNVSTGGYPWRLMTKPGPKGTTGPAATFLSTGTTSEADTNTHPRDDTRWLWFETAPLAKNLRIFGEIQLQVWLSAERTWVTLTPTVVDVDPARYGDDMVADSTDQIPSATRGWLDSRYRKGLGSQAAITPGAPFGMTVVLKPQDYTFAKGHRIGLSIQTEIVEWNVPKPYLCTTPGCPTIRIVWEGGKTRLILPVVGPTTGLFA